MAFHAIVSDDRDRFVFHMQTARHNRRRSISASICLLMVVLLYTPLAGAAWSSYQMACCHDSDRSLVTPMVFVLPLSIAVDPSAAIKSLISLTNPVDFLRSIEPLSPPPRFISAAA